VPVSAGPISISRSLQDPVSCTLEEWAPLGGPVRPLLQVRVCVWGGVRACVRVLAENMLVALGWGG
jgi:hypothetical protein